MRVARAQPGSRTGIMLPFALSIAGVVVGIVLLVLYFPVGIPVLLIALIALLVVAVRSRRPGESLGTLERTRTRSHEPTGKPRPASSGPETANERQGQV